PARGIKKFREHDRDRFLQSDELPRFFAALDAEPNEHYRHLFLVALLTGVRRGNVLAMRWDQLHLDAATWTLPETKNGHPVTVVLVSEVVEILRERQARCGASPWVFPGRGKSGHLEEVKSAWQRILDRAGIADLRIHDLRRTLGSWQVATGA